MSTLRTTPAASIDDIRHFFDAFASANVEQHGKAAALLNYRISLIKKYAGFRYHDEVLDIGCGNGHHLFAMDGYFRHATGIDISAGMVHAAERRMPATLDSFYDFFVDDAQILAHVPDASKDVVLCVGALEHMPDKRAVLESVNRVLRPGGRFVCLTLNDRFVWYRHLAPSLGYETRHLATDRRLDKSKARTLMGSVGFRQHNVSHWTFIPRGDMPPFYANLCHCLDYAGRLAFADMFRGGLVLYGEK